jgi:hypothetical protein
MPSWFAKLLEMLKECQILLDKSCVLTTSKKIYQVKKRVNLQQFSIIHLPNPDLTYIRNLEREKIGLYPIHLLKTYIRNPYIFFISFFTFPPTGKRWWQPQSARVYIHAGRGVECCRVDLPNCWRSIFLILPKLDVCQFGLPNCWSCSNPRHILPNQNRWKGIKIILFFSGFPI